MNGPRGWLVAVIAAAMFGAACGVIGGIGVVHFVIRFHPGEARRLLHGGPPPGGPPGERFGPPLDRLARDLDLSETQREQIGAEVDRTRLETRALRESLRVRIERRLTPAQRARFDRMAPRFDPRWGRGSWPRPDRAAPGEEGEEPK